MTTFTAIIASTDDLDLDDCNDIGAFLVSSLKDGSLDDMNAEAFHFESDADDETVTLIARGLFFQNDWCMDDTISTVTTTWQGHHKGISV